MRDIRLDKDLDADGKLAALKELSDEYNGVEPIDGFLDGEGNLDSESNLDDTGRPPNPRNRDPLPDAERAELEKHAQATVDATRAEEQDNTNAVRVQLQGDPSDPKGKQNPSSLQGNTPCWTRAARRSRPQPNPARGSWGAGSSVAVGASLFQGRRMYTELDICNIALGRIGVDKTVMNLANEQSKEARLCRLFYPMARDEVAGEGAVAVRRARQGAGADDRGRPDSGLGLRLRDAAGRRRHHRGGVCRRVTEVASYYSDCCGPWMPLRGVAPGLPAGDVRRRHHAGDPRQHRGRLRGLHLAADQHRRLLHP